MKAALTNAFFDMLEAQLLSLVDRAGALLQAAGVPYRIVGGLAVYLYVEQAFQGAGRLTRDVDVAVYRRDVARIAELAPQFGFRYRHAAGVDMLLDSANPDARRAVHFVFASEKVRPEYVEPAPGLDTAPVLLGDHQLIPVADLVRMKLTSFRLKDRVHIQDLDAAGLITPEIEQALSPVLRERLAEVRATE